jgi:hypothetical protein
MADKILHLRTSTGTPLPLAASQIELFGEMNGWAFVRTKSGFQHLIQGTVEELTAEWERALRDGGSRVIDTTSSHPFSPRAVSRGNTLPPKTR